MKGAIPIFKPISTIFDLLDPYNQIKMSNGSIQSEISFIRATVLSFCDVSVFILSGAIIGKWISSHRTKLDRHRGLARP